VRVDRRAFLAAAAATASSAAACSWKRERGPLARAAEYLWAQQAADGGFHSATYGLLRSGQSLTPLVLGALLRVPEAILPAPDGAVDRALAFMRAHTNADGALGLIGSDSDDYPNYATALAVHAMVTARRGTWTREIAPMITQLRAQQFSEVNGWMPEHAAYGGWGMGGPIHRPPEAGHVDLSMTRFVIEALRAAGVQASDPAMTRALVFLERSQNHDGGFIFSPVMRALNKAGQTDGGSLSYGTTTADGVLALRASGLADRDERITRAVGWLQANHRPDRVPGFVEDESPQHSWSTGLRFYYAAAIARVLPGASIILPRQSDDGSFRNANNRVKEDDPLIATPFAIHVLTRPGSDHRG
jgi:squalene-hopene/tetraprenyl-beta-curcumene cyclase